MRVALWGVDWVYDRCLTRRYVSEHMVTHSDHKPHQCPHCPYRTTGTGHLHRHIRTHNGERPHVCDWPGCDYASGQLAHLRTHKRKHTGEQPFACPVEVKQPLALQFFSCCNQ
jgi:uncharacterized Zn-finger protein